MKKAQSTDPFNQWPGIILSSSDSWRKGRQSLYTHSLHSASSSFTPRHQQHESRTWT